MKEKTMERITSSKIVRVAMAMALVLSVAIVPTKAYASGNVNVSIGKSIPYAGYETTQMSANGNDAYCIEPSRSTPDAGTYPTSEAGDLAAAMWFSYGAPGFDASMWPSSWYDGSGMDEDKYRVASHILLSYANLGSAAEATYGTSAEFASWAEREIAGDVWSQVNARANEVSTGFSAIRIHAGSDAQTLASFTWERGGVKIAKVDAQAGAGEQGDASLEGAEFAIVNASGMNSYVNGHSYADGETVMTISTSWDGSAYTAQTASDALPCGTYRIVEANAPEGYLPWEGELGFAIEGDGQVVDLSGDPVHDDAIRGGVQVTKADAELGESEAVGGNGHAAEGVGTTLSGHRVRHNERLREQGPRRRCLVRAGRGRRRHRDRVGRGNRLLHREDRARRAALRHLHHPGDRDQRLLPAHRRRAEDLRDPDRRPCRDGGRGRRRAHLLQPGRPQRPQALQEGRGHQREPAGSLRHLQRGDPARRTCWSPTATARLRPRRAGTGTPPTPTETTSCSKPTASRPV